MSKDKGMDDTLRRRLSALAPEGRPAPRILSLLRDSSRAAAASMDDFYCRLEREDDEERAPLAAEDYYRERDGRPFMLSWPLSADAELPDRFDRLDRPTQFTILFDEWQRRESESLLCLAAGQIDDAELLFQECLSRARQLGVGELEGRSFDGLRRIAERRGRIDTAREWTRRGEAARRRDDEE